MNDLKLAGVFNTIDTLIRRKVMKPDPINNRCYVRKSNKPLGHSFYMRTANMCNTIHVDYDDSQHR